MTEQLQRVQALMTQNAGESAVIKNLQQEIERQKGLIQARDKKMEQLQEEQKGDRIEVGKLREQIQREQINAKVALENEKTMQNRVKEQDAIIA